MSDLLAPETTWKMWTFDERLRVFEKPRETVEPPPLNQQLAAEEGLETLLTLNLERIFPDWKLRLNGNIDKSFTATDIEATDPAGVQHIFELKYGDPSNEVISQTLAYALDRVGACDVQWFDEEDEAARDSLLARRILGFWAQIRSDTHSPSSFPSLPRKQALRRGLEVLADESAEDIVPEMALEWARDHRRAMEMSDEKMRHWPEHPKDVHLHFVVPNVKTIDETELEVLRRLKERGLRADIWEVRLDVQRGGDGRSGRLAVREVPLRGDGYASPRLPSGHRLSELLSNMAWRKPPVFGSTPSWELHEDDGKTRLLVELPVEDEPCNGPYFGITVTGDELKFEAFLSVPGHLSDAHSLTDLREGVSKESFGAVRDWIAEVFPPDEEEYPTAYRRLQDFVHKTKKWEGTLRIPGGQSTVRASGRHTGGVRQAKIVINIDDDFPAFDELARLGVHLFSTFVDELGGRARPAGWSCAGAGRVGKA